MLGVTGCGKTTTIQYLQGAKMLKSNDGHIQAYPMPSELKYFISSPAMHSITQTINPLNMKYTNENNETETVTILDTAGFGET